MVFAKQQRGASGIATMYLIVTAVLLVTLLFKIGPAYMDNYSYNGIIERLMEDKDLKAASRMEIQADLGTRLRVNGHYNFSNEYWSLEKDKEGNSILLQYDQHIPLFYNLSAVVSFSKSHKL